MVVRVSVARGQPVEARCPLLQQEVGSSTCHPAKAVAPAASFWMCAEFLIGGGTDEPIRRGSNHRLEDAGRITAPRRTSPHDGEFVHKEDGGAVPHQPSSRFP